MKTLKEGFLFSSYAYSLVLLLPLKLVSGQSCYYPNGDISKEQDVPCGGGIGACCPLNWQCYSNGMCFDPTTGYMGRYTCVDKSWGASCPQFCDGGNTGGSVSGNEAMSETGNGEYCCDGSRNPSSDCTQGDPDKWFALQNGTTEPVLSVTSASSAAKSFSTSSAAATSSKASSSVQPSSTSSSLTVKASRGTDVVGPLVIGSITTTYTPSRTSSNNANSALSGQIQIKSSTSTPMGLIIGSTIGIPAVVAALGLLAYLLWRWRKNNKKDNDPFTVHSYYSDKPKPKKPNEDLKFTGVDPSEIDGTELVHSMQRYPIKGPNPIQINEILGPPGSQVNEGWSRETTMMTLPRAAANVSPNTANIVSPPYSPVSTMSPYQRPESYSQFSPTGIQGPWDAGKGNPVAELEGSCPRGLSNAIELE